VSGLKRTIGSAVTGVGGGLGEPLVSAAVIQGSTAVSAIQTINKTITNFPVTSPINTADFTKVASSIGAAGALSSIGPLSIPEVNGVLAQAKNLVGQASGALSNAKGLGSFGLDIGQLETAGFVKPGTKALMAAASSTFASVVKSPAIWTGKDGIKSATDLLSSVGKQSKIQQDLMTKGVAAMGAVGIPVANLSSQGIAGMALNAAKSLPNTEAFAKGLPIPGDATGALTAAMSGAVRDGAFAVNLVNTKIPAVFKEQDIPIPKIDTVNRATLDAAASRVAGDPKIPVPDYGANPTVEKSEYQAMAEDYVNKVTNLINNILNPTGRAQQGIETKLSALENQQSITQSAYDAVLNEYTTIRAEYNNIGPEKIAEARRIYEKLPAWATKTLTTGPFAQATIAATVTYLQQTGRSIRERLAVLGSKIEGRGEGE
jgi:hypothetical protein